MTSLDLVLLAIVAVSALFGLMRGLVGTVVSLLAWGLAGWMAFHHGGDIALLMARRGAPTPADLLAGHALAFIGVLVLVGAVGWLVRWLLRAIGLSGLDRLLGMALGIVRGVLVACMLVLVLGFTRLPQGEAWAHSRCLPLLMPGVALMAHWLPEWAIGELDLGHGPGFGNGAPAGDNAHRQEHDPKGDAAGALPAPVGEGDGPVLSRPAR